MCRRPLTQESLSELLFALFCIPILFCCMVEIKMTEKWRNPERVEETLSEVKAFFDKKISATGCESLWGVVRRGGGWPGWGGGAMVGPGGEGSGKRGEWPCPSHSIFFAAASHLGP